MAHMAAYLEQNQTLQELDLSFNHIGEKGAVIFASSLYNNTSLRRIVLSGNPLGNRGINAIVAIEPTTEPILKPSSNPNPYPDCRYASCSLVGARYLRVRV